MTDEKRNALMRGDCPESGCPGRPKKTGLTTAKCPACGSEWDWVKTGIWEEVKVEKDC